MSNNKIIVRNTIFLYVRMIVIMLIGFYTVRALLEILGVEDYGIYNVVGGVVSMFSFLNGTLSTSSQRYFSVEIAKGDYNELNKTFCLNINVFLILSCLIIVIAETVGLWFVNCKMTIPSDRLFAANVIYQISILSFVLSMISVPYNALIIAHEQMKAFAQISIVEAFFKLLIVFVLRFVTCDKLITYGFLYFFSSTSIVAVYILYCRRKFPESKYKLYWNKDRIIELFSFSGWHFLGTLSSVLRTQGINILLNVFFNPAINAARAISVQVSYAVTQLSNNFFVAVKPQLYKSYAVGDMRYLYQLIFRSSIICVFLVSIITIPLVVTLDFVLDLWLKDVPEKAVIFSRLMLWHSLIYSINGVTIVPALATGKIKKFQIYTSALNCLILPISYFVLLYNALPESTVVVAIVIAAATIILQAYMLKKMINFPFKSYSILLLKLAAVSIIIWRLLLLVSKPSNMWLWVIEIGVVSLILHIILYYAAVITKADRLFLKSEITKKFVKK